MPRKLRTLAVTIAALIAYGQANADLNVATSRAQGIAALNRGDYDEAFKAWFLPATEGDTEQMELIGLLLLSDGGSKIRGLARGSHHAIGLKYLYTAAAHGRASAMIRIAEGSRFGNIGLVRNTAAADCWSAAAHGKQDVVACAPLTEFHDERSRPGCLSLIALDDRPGLTADAGARAARLCIANRSLAIVTPGGPPSPSDLLSQQAYARFGIEQTYTGCILVDRYERYREGFRTVMDAAIIARHGADIHGRVQSKVDAQMKAARR